MKLALVTGATGTVGSAIVARLLADGVQVRCLVRNAHLAKTALGNRCELVVGDVLDEPSLRTAAKGCDAIFHAAGLPEQWLRQPDLFHRVNVEGTRHALRAAIGTQADVFVHIGTQDVLDLSRPRYDESRARRPVRRSRYVRSKLDAQELVDGAAAVGLSVRSLLPAAVYGAGALAPTGLSAFLLNTFMRGGTFLIRGGVSVVYNLDVAAAAVAAARREGADDTYLLAESFQTLENIVGVLRKHRGELPEPIVLPAWSTRPLGRVAETIAAITGNPPAVTSAIAGALTHTGRADCSRAVKDLAWRPTPFEVGVAETLAAWGLETRSCVVRDAPSR